MIGAIKSFIGSLVTLPLATVARLSAIWTSPHAKPKAHPLPAAPTPDPVLILTHFVCKNKECGWLEYVNIFTDGTPRYFVRASKTGWWQKPDLGAVSKQAVFVCEGYDALRSQLQMTYSNEDALDYGLGPVRLYERDLKIRGLL